MKKFILVFLFMTASLYSQSNEIDNLLLKINQSKNPTLKKELIEQLKIKLAKRNKKVQEESDAIIKAKSKLPTKTFKLEN